MDKALQKYVVYVIGESSPLSKREEILDVVVAFTRGWFTEKAVDELFLNLRARASLASYRRRTGENS
jgi:hypothetical protein